MVNECGIQVAAVTDRLPRLNRLTDSERLRLIGDLLCKGILALPIDLAPNSQSPHAAVSTPEESVVHYLRRHKSASPSEMRAVLGLSRTRTSLALRRLALAGRIAANGRMTTATAYRLIDPSRN